MDHFLQLSDFERRITFTKAAERTGLSEDIIEKDFWVCWTLKELFKLEIIKEHLTFKGGTSLAKIYKVINRFSEDIDVSIDRVYFGFKDSKDPTKASSAKQAQKLIDDLGIACQKFVSEVLIEKLNDAVFLAVGRSTWKLEMDKDDIDQQTILFYYPKVTISTSTYINPAVKIELGARSDHWPVGMQKIAPYIIEVLPEYYSKDMEAEIRVLNIERTFWEKATILHMYANYPADKIVPERQSRHYFDFYCLLSSDGKTKALASIELLEKVVAHKMLYFKAAWANYQTAKQGSLKLIPGSQVLEAIKKDFKAMSEMFAGEVPKWDEIILTISKFEEKFNESNKKS